MSRQWCLAVWHHWMSKSKHSLGNTDRLFFSVGSVGFGYLAVTKAVKKRLFLSRPNKTCLTGSNESSTRCHWLFPINMTSSCFLCHLNSLRHVSNSDLCRSVAMSLRVDWRDDDVFASFPSFCSECSHCSHPHGKTLYFFHGDAQMFYPFLPKGWHGYLDLRHRREATFLF